MATPNKTQATDASPLAFIESVTPPRRREDGLTLLGWFGEVTGLTPRMWGTSLIGYGRYQYQYDSGHSGDYFLTGFSPRKAALSVYIMPGYQDLSEPLSRLGKHKTGKSCLYINRLSDIDMRVLEEIVTAGLLYMRTHYTTKDN